MAFDHLSPVLSDALTARGYEALTPVQAQVVEADASGRDLLVSAQTGSGKTVAFGLAMAEQLIEDGRLPFATSPLALIVAPTRELALQVSRELSWLYAKAGARIATCVGGMDASKERRNLNQGVHIVVGTPGRLRDHLERGALDLAALRVAVLDEADEMLDMGFRDDLEEILDATPDTRRTLLFSATLPKPIVQLAKRYQQDALRISTVGEDRGHGDISYQAVTVAPADIEGAVINLLRLHDAETAMLFCATRDNVRRLHASLTDRGFAAVALSGEHSQNERNSALQALRDRRAKVCVATDVAARGIDLPSLSLVVHVEIPRDAETLQHRSGRTGRAGKKGTAVLIVPYPRRRRVDGMLRGARINAEWMDAPTAADVRLKDQERLIEKLLAPVEHEPEDIELAQRLMAERSAEDIAAALVRAHRASMPAPEDLIDNSARPRGERPERGERGDRFERPERGERREQFDDSVWFKLNIGRRQNADPRWILPLLCRRGHVTKQEIGAIRIGPSETMFNIPRAIADRFAEAVVRSANADGEDDSGVAITPAPDGPTYPPRREKGARDTHRSAPRGAGERAGPRGPGGPGGKPERYKPKPYGQRSPRKSGKY
ncbi:MULTISPECIES: DEAD/DEAH box helicase [unclassified Sphingopyxis]|uniref:DEAD/DEAH box helicase n=1 Tax=unclassified Sphingopyxis TaxID=2614943 RepID=UPI00073665F5|nr:MULTISPECIES: DEAD/DEAH box helicase [unclassified Sphingopyxis]KTE44309.1 DEAD/DEAH box helicase [Sphingopyxis sp. HIX]KTE85956.1 DEAD/DEAH box helicase [Sphingopyxis sp. HXXIV]